jgi:hypothetical protein
MVFLQELKCFSILFTEEICTKVMFLTQENTEKKAVFLSTSKAIYSDEQVARPSCF